MSPGRGSRFNRPVIIALLIVVALLTGKFAGVFQPVTNNFNESNRASYQAHTHISVSEAFQDQLQEVLVEGSGTVVKILPDDNKGSRHQRLIIRVGTKQTILIAHNIDLAPRIPNISRGDSLDFRGSYVYNDKGGIVHWTHHDPRGEHPDGWLIHNGKTYK